MIQQGRTTEAEAEFEKLLGVSEAKFAIAELSKVDRGDENDTVKLSELLHGRHFKGTYFFLFYLQNLEENLSSLFSSLDSLCFQLFSFIYGFVLQLFLLDQPCLLYNSSLV